MSEFIKVSNKKKKPGELTAERLIERIDARMYNLLCESHAYRETLQQHAPMMAFLSTLHTALHDCSHCCYWNTFSDVRRVLWPGKFGKLAQVAAPTRLVTGTAEPLRRTLFRGSMTRCS
jgi:hypothetical protein